MKIQLDIGTMDDALYDALLAAFRNEAAKQNLQPESDLYFDEWVVSCVAMGESSTINKEGQGMNDTDLQILEMYHKDGMKEKEIADSLKLSLFIVYDVLTAFDWTEEDKT